MTIKGFSINDMNEEYLKGARTIISFLRDEGIICKSIDKCGECSKVNVMTSASVEEIMV